MDGNRAIVTVYSKLPRENSSSPHRYLAVVEMADTGYRCVELVLISGVKDIPTVPYMMTVSCDDSYVELRKGQFPILAINEWQPMTHYYM